jgi:hypothetical protein
MKTLLTLAVTVGLVAAMGCSDGKTSTKSSTATTTTSASAKP